MVGNQHRSDEFRKYKIKLDKCKHAKHIKKYVLLGKGLSIIMHSYSALLALVYFNFDLLTTLIYLE